jgi:hypothetical protein
VDVLVLRRDVGGETVTCVYNFGAAQIPVPKKNEKILSSCPATGL